MSGLDAIREAERAEEWIQRAHKYHRLVHAAEADAVALAEALHTFGRHQQPCNRLMPADGSQCTCGLFAALTTHEERLKR